MPDQKPDPGDSLIRRAKKKMDDSTVVEVAIRYIVMALLGAGSAVATHKVEDAQTEAAHYASEAKVLALEAEVDSLREGLKQRIEVEMRERLDAEARAAVTIERRVSRIETKLNIQPPQ